MTPVKRHLLYIFRGSLLRLRITWPDKQMLTLSVGFHVDKGENKRQPKWDGRRCRLNTSHGPDKVPASVINSALDKLESNIDKAFYSFEVNDITPDAKALKEALQKKTGDKADLFLAFSEFIREGESLHQWAPNTAKSVRQVSRLLQLFDHSLTFSKLDAKTFDRFIEFQTSHKLLNSHLSLKNSRIEKQTNHGYSNAVIQKHHNILKWFLRWAIRKGYVDNNIEKYFSLDIKKIDRPVIFLTREELDRIVALPLTPGSNEEKVRDFFCFCCFSSLRYSDAVALKKSDVKDNYLQIVSQKTSKPLIIDLNSHSKRILEKYRKSKSSFALPQVPNNLVNRLIKKLARMASIDEPVAITQYYGNSRKQVIHPKYELLSSHTARRTFICNALSFGISPVMVMKWTGHSEYSSLKPYIEMVDNLRSEAMEKFDSEMLKKP